MAGVHMGIVTCLKRCHWFAPSTSAASYKERGTSCSAARKITIAVPCAQQEITTVVLAQLSMTVFSLSYPDSEERFGAKVLTSGESGFARVGAVLKALEAPVA